MTLAAGLLGYNGKMGRVVRSIYSPSWWVNEALPHLLTPAMIRYFEHFGQSGCDVMEEDWDTLLVLDACRYDMFEGQHSFPGSLSARISKGSDTAEFFEENFLGTEHHDTVYVTANPVPKVSEWCNVDVDTVFHDVVDVWAEHWDDQSNTVRPEPVSEAIKDAHEEYPDKRILGHFIQPHQPFIGPAGEEIDEVGMTAYDELAGEDADVDRKVWEQLRHGEISSELVWRAYRENLDLVLPHVERLCDDLEGKIVVTADHGNLLGEFIFPFPARGFGHPSGIGVENLVKVPWLEVPCQERRDIVAEPPVGSAADAGENERLERLEALGYR